MKHSKELAAEICTAPTLRSERELRKRSSCTTALASLQHPLSEQQMKQPLAETARQLRCTIAAPGKRGSRNQRGSLQQFTQRTSYNLQHSVAPADHCTRCQKENQPLVQKTPERSCHLISPVSALIRSLLVKNSFSLQ